MKGLFSLAVFTSTLFRTKNLIWIMVVSTQESLIFY